MKFRISIQSLFILALLVLLFLLPKLGLSKLYIYVLSLMFIWCIVACSVRLLMLAGLITFSILGFMEIGAYTTAILPLKTGLSFWPSLLLGGLIAGIIAFIIGKPLLKLQSVYFFLINIALGGLIGQLVVSLKGLTGGNQGLGGILRPTGFESDAALYYLILIITILILYVFYRLHVGRFSKILYASRTAEPLVKSMGLDVSGYKLKGFLILCIFSAIAGGLYTPLVGYLYPDSFSEGFIFYLIAYIVVGGQMVFAGPIVGTIIMRLISTQLTHTLQYEPIILGVILIFFSMLAPYGIVGFGVNLFKGLILPFPNRKGKVRTYGNSASN